MKMVAAQLQPTGRPDRDDPTDPLPGGGGAYIRCRLASFN